MGFIRLSHHPSLYQINTRVWLTELSRQAGRKLTLEDVPDAELDRLTELGFEWIWLLSVWQTGLEAQRVSRTHPQWRHEFEQTLSDLSEDDIVGSGFAITGYTIHAQLGGDAALARLRDRLKKRGLRLMLDFVPNHMGLGHPWIENHPEYFVSGSECDLERSPENYIRLRSRSGERVFAYGRDPYFPGWPDTLQLNYANAATHEAMIGELLKIACQCDGVRCDMAMLLLPEVFERTWGSQAAPFWPRAIEQVRGQVPGFTFLAEVYWDLEWTLQQQGFDYTYDKRLYDRLREGYARPVREHLVAGLDYQDRLARFLENHDEPRAAATLPDDIHRAAAVVTYLTPGLRFFHQGQLEGCRVRISPHLGRAPREAVNESMRQFYLRLLHILRNDVVRDGSWQLLNCTPGWDENATYDAFIVFAWECADQRLIVAVNYSPHQSQCHVQLPFAGLAGRRWKLGDQLSSQSYVWHGDDLRGRGLFLDMKPWQVTAFALDPEA